jgi:hypothetical protein
MAKAIATRKRIVRRDWTRADVKELKQHSRDKTPSKQFHLGRGDRDCRLLHEGGRGDYRHR